MATRILGLDPGLAILGFGIIDATAPTPRQKEAIAALDFGIIETPPHTPLGDRLTILYDDLNSVLSQWQPDLVAVEKLFFYRMGNTIQVAQARGVVMLVLAQHHLPLMEFTPAQVKQAITGYGNADKHAVQQAVAQELHLPSIPRPDDAADGLAIALAAWFQR